jgi:hypothetical protein
MTIKKLIGSDPNQISLNRDLGSMAFQDVAMFAGPAFIAYPTTNQTLSGAGTITWNATTLNIGNGFNTGTSTFTAPVGGLYWFSIRLTNAGTTQRIPYVSLSVGGGRTRDLYEQQNMDVSNVEINSSLIWPVNAGEAVTIITGGGMLVEGGNVNYYSMWQGYLIRGIY